MLNRRHLVQGLAAFLSAGVELAPASAEDGYPERAIKVVIPNTPGGPGDVIARAFSDVAAQSLGKPFVFEYRAGGTTIVGSLSVAKSEPDGYTILGFPSAGLAVSVLRKDMPYSLEHDFRPVIGIGTIPLALVVRADSRFKSFADLAAAIKKGDITYGSAGAGTIAHLTAAWLLSELNGSATHIPYRGNPEVMRGIMGGDIDFFFSSIGDAVPLAGANRIRVIGVTANQRISEFSDAPMMSELGLPHFNSKLWYAFLAPSRTTDAVVARLYSAFAQAAKDPSLQKRLSTLGFVVELRDPEGVTKMMKDEASRWKRVIELNKITLGD